MARFLKPVRVEGDVAYVPLTQGYAAIIDAGDAEFVGQWNWYAHVKGRIVYATRRAGQTIYLHRVLAEVENGLEVDHIDGDGLNNRRANLRVATTSQNQFNSRKPSNNKSGFKGVFLDRRTGKWRAAIKKNRVCRELGYFDTPEQAYWAYCEASADLHGEFGRVA